MKSWQLMLPWFSTRVKTLLIILITFPYREENLRIGIITTLSKISNQTTRGKVVRKPNVKVQNEV